MRSSLLPLLCVTWLACAPARGGPLPGASDAWKQSLERPVASKVTAPPWAGYEQLRALRPLNSEPFTSQGHQPPVAVDIVVNDSSSAAYRAIVTDSSLPEGTLLAELPRDASAHGLVMQKHADGWSYLELDAEGRLLEEGRLPRCDGCHALAPADHVFGLPREPPAKAAAPPAKRPE